MFILFRGDVIDDTRKAGAIEKFAALFGVSSQQAAPFFQRRAVFFRNGLDSFTARRYYRSLTAVGTEVFLGRESALPFESPDAAELQNLPVAACPLCQTKQIVDQSCVVCNQKELKEIQRPLGHGPYEHDKDAASALIATGDSKPGHVPEEIKTHSEKARKALWIGCLLMLVALIFDEFIADYALFEAVALWKKNTLDLGLFPYLVATLIITYGCLHYVRLKGYPTGFGLLGLANLMGLGILILLPSRRQTDRKKPYLNPIRFGSLLMIGFTLWWASGFFHMQKDAVAFLDRPVPFLMDAYDPDFDVEDGNVATEDILIERETYLKAYIDEAFDLLATHEFDIDTTARIADGIYSGISNLSIWSNYQHFLYRINDYEIPNCFRQEEIEARLRAYLKDVSKRNTQLENGIVARTHKDWTMMYYREDDAHFREIGDLGRKLSTLVYRPIVFPWDPAEREKDITERISDALDNFDSTKELFEIEYEPDSRRIWILLKPDLTEPLAGKTICFGIWEKPGRVSWSQKKGTHRKTVTVFKRIGGDLPGKYLPPDFGNDLAKVAVQIASVEYDSQS